MIKAELKDEMKNRISLALKDPILQQSFEIMCKENAELKKDIDYFSDALDKQIEATLELQKKYQELEEQIEKMKADVKQGQSYWNSGEMQYDLYKRLLDKWEIKEK